jgi:hypothetical protein
MDYDFGNKRQYRRDVWAFVDRHCKKPIKERKVMFMDTKEGGETLFLLNKGYRPENLFVANNNPGQVAQLTKNLKKDCKVEVNTYGIDVGTAMCKVSDQGYYIDAYNLDYMCTVTNSDFYDDLYMLGNYILKDHHIVIVNILRGRERKGFFDEYEVGSKDERTADSIRSFEIKRLLTSLIHHDGMSDNEETRIKFGVTRSGEECTGQCLNHILSQRDKIYRSNAGSQTMRWFAFDLIKHYEMKKNDILSYMFRGNESGDFPWCYSAKYNLKDIVIDGKEDEWLQSFLGFNSNGYGK